MCVCVCVAILSLSILLFRSIDELQMCDVLRCLTVPAVIPSQTGTPPFSTPRNNLLSRIRHGDLTERGDSRAATDERLGGNV